MIALVGTEEGYLKEWYRKEAACCVDHESPVKVSKRGL